MSLPASGFYITGGTLRSDAPSYVERQADRDLLEGLRRGEFCYVLTSRQMGKSSLMIRTATKLREEGTQVVVLDLTAIGQNLTAEQWYDGMLMRLGRQLNLEEELEVYWAGHKRLGPVQRFFQALRDVVLPRRDGPLVVFVDEIDVVRSLPFQADEFFAAIRECYNDRTEHPALRRISFCLLGVASPSDLIRDTRMTPFNIGRRIELNDFTAEEALPLARGLAEGGRRSHSQARAALERVLHWTNGHPYLTQRFCLALAARAATDEPAIDAVCDELFLSNRAREQDDNLLFVRDRLLRGQADPAGLLLLYADALRGRPPVVDDAAHPLAGVLRLSGIVRSQNGHLRVRNAIYAHVFDRKWIEASMPDAELRRQRAAFRRGVIRTASISAAVVLALAALWGYARWEAWRAEEALKRWKEEMLRASQAQSQTRRLLGLAGQRFEGLEAIRKLPATSSTLALRNEAIACLALADLRSITPELKGLVALGDGLRQYLSKDESGILVVRRWPEGTVLWSLPATANSEVRFRLGPAGGSVAAVAERHGEADATVWRMGSDAPVLEITNIVARPIPEFSADDSQVAISGPGAALRIFEVNPGTTNLALQGESPPALVKLRPGLSNQVAMVWSNQFLVTVRDVAPGAPESKLSVPAPVESLAWSPDGSQLAAACADRRIYLWRLPATKRHLVLEGHQGVPEHLAFSPSGQLLASAGADQTLRLWDTAGQGGLLVTLAGPRGLRQLAFGRGDRELAALTEDGAVQVWEVAPTAVCRSLAGAAAGLLDFQISTDGRWLAGARPDGIEFWDVETGESAHHLKLNDPRSVAFHPETGELFASRDYGVVGYARQDRVGDQEAGTSFGPGRLVHFGAQAGPLTIGTNGQWLAVAWPDRVQIISTTESVARPAHWFGPGVFASAVSGNGRWIAVRMEKANEIQIYEFGSTNLVRTLNAAARTRLAFAPSGQWLAGATEQEWRVWRTETWEEVWQGARGPGLGRLAALAFSPDSRVLAGGLTDGLVELVEASSGAALATLTPPRRDALVALRFSPDGTRLFCATENSTLWMWDLWRLRDELAGLGLDWRAPALASRLPVLTGGRLELNPELNEEDAKLLKPGSLHGRANQAVQRGDFALAAVYWERCLEIKNNGEEIGEEPWIRRDLGWIYLWGPPELRDDARARDLLKEAVRIEPGNKDNHHRLGAAQARLGDCEAALESLRTAETLARSKDGSFLGRVRLLQAFCLTRLNRDSEAKLAREKALPEMKGGLGDPARFPPSRSQIEWQELEREDKRVFGR